MSHYNGIPKEGSGRRPLDKDSETALVQFAIPRRLLNDFAFVMEEKGRKNRAKVIRELIQFYVDINSEG